MITSRPSLVVALLALVPAVGALGCSSQRALMLDPQDELRLPVELDAPTVSIAFADPTDARPLAEREGRAPKETDRGVPFVGEVEIERGSIVSGDDDLGDDAVESMGSTLKRYLRSIEHVKIVESSKKDDDDDRDAPRADYTLETEVLHLAAASFHSRRELDVPVVDWFLDPAVEQGFLPVANVVLRLRLRSADGRFKATRVVNASVLGSPDEAKEPAELVAAAMRAAAHETRQLTASWLVRAESAPSRGSAQQDDLPTTFLVHAVDVNRTGVVLAEIDRETGQVQWIERREGLPLIGPPGVWHLCPFDEHGVMLPPAEYAALSEGLSRSFGLQRLDQLAVYRYLGPIGR